MEVGGRGGKKFLVFLRLVFTIFVGTDVSLPVSMAMEWGGVQLNFSPLRQIFQRLIVHFSINIKNNNSSIVSKNTTFELKRGIIANRNALFAMRFSWILT